MCFGTPGSEGLFQCLLSNLWGYDVKVPCVRLADGYRFPRLPLFLFSPRAVFPVRRYRVAKSPPEGLYPMNLWCRKRIRFLWRIIAFACVRGGVDVFERFFREFGTVLGEAVVQQDFLDEVAEYG